VGELDASLTWTRSTVWAAQTRADRDGYIPRLQTGGLREDERGVVALLAMIVTPDLISCLDI